MCIILGLFDSCSTLVREMFGKKAIFRGFPERFPKDTRTKHFCDYFSISLKHPCTGGLTGYSKAVFQKNNPYYVKFNFFEDKILKWLYAKNPLISTLGILMNGLYLFRCQENKQQCSVEKTNVPVLYPAG